MVKTMRATEARRLKFTPELLADVRRRFEGSDEPLSTMAADLGCCKTTLRGIAKREGWVRFEPPPRDLLPAARLLARAEKLSPFVPAKAGTQEQDSEAVASGPGSPLARGRTDTPAVPTPEQVRADIAALYADVVQANAEFKLFREGLKGKPLGLLERERVARTFATLSATLHRLQVMLAEAPTAIPQNEIAYDDMPADLDEFRDALARRIEAFFASRPDAGDGGPSAADGAADAAS